VDLARIQAYLDKSTLPAAALSYQHHNSDLHLSVAE